MEMNSETDQKSVELTGLVDGSHSVEVKTTEFNGIPRKYLFEVDTVGPSITIFGSDRYSGGLADGDFRPFGRYLFVEWAFSEPVTKVELGSERSPKRAIRGLLIGLTGILQLAVFFSTMSTLRFI